MRNFSALALLLLALLFGFQNCGTSNPFESSFENLASRNCKINTKLSSKNVNQNLFSKQAHRLVFSNNKIKLQDNLKTGKIKHYFAKNNQKAKSTTTTLPNSSFFNLTYDYSCTGKKLKHNYLSSMAKQFKKTSYTNLEGITTHQILLPKNTTPDQLQEWVNTDPCIVGLTTPIKIKPSYISNDPQSSLQLHLQTIKAHAAWDIFQRPPFLIDDLPEEQSVVVAVIDTGVRYNHEDLKNIMWHNPNEIDNGVDDDNNGIVDDIHGASILDVPKDSVCDPYGNNFNLDQCTPDKLQSLTIKNGDPMDPPTSQYGGHGTHIAGLIAAQHNNSKGVIGVANQKIKIMALNVFGNNNSTGDAQISGAIYYATDHGADIINMSLGGYGESPLIERALEYAAAKGVFVSIASGNDGREPKTGKNSLEWGKLTNEKEVCVLNPDNLDLGSMSAMECPQNLNGKTVLAIYDCSSISSNCSGPSNAYSSDDYMFFKKGFSAPANYARDIPGVISVGAVTATSGSKTSYSNHSPENFVQIAAPGSESEINGVLTGLLSTYTNSGSNSSNSEYIRKSGTSMAAPLVAGAAAIALAKLRAKGIPASNVELEDLILYAADNKTNLYDYFTYGRSLNLLKVAEIIDTLNYGQSISPEELPLCP